MWLIPLHDDVSGNLPFKLKDGEFTIGRALNCHLTIADDTLSRTHARLVVSQNEEIIHLEDLLSKNGTFVNGVRIERCRLTEDSIIRLAAVHLKLAAEIPRTVSLSHWQIESTRRQPALTRRAPRHEPIPSSLTTAQREVCALLLEGLDEPAIAERLERSIHTVHNHVRKIYKACNVHSREELMAKLLRKL